MSQKLEEIVEKLSQLTVVDVAKLKSMLEEKWGVSAAAPVAVAAAPAGGAGAAPAAEAKTTFDVVLKETGANKIGVIKEVRAVTSLGLKEAKDLVDGVPNTIKASADKDEAEAIRKKFADIGTTVKLEPVS